MSDVSEKFLISVKITPYWSDMDALGHINNSKYFTYFEEARIEWLKSIGMDSSAWENAETGPVLINANCTFLKMVTYPAELEVRLSAGSPGKSSFLFRYEIQEGEDLCAEGSTKVVWVDFAEGRPVPLPDLVRKALQ